MQTQDIQIVRSRNRKKTVSAQLKDGIIHIRAPHNIKEKELNPIIDKLKQKINKKHTTSDISLLEIAKNLNNKYFAGKLIIHSIEYSSRQKHRFGSCNLLDGRILISDRLKNVPKWVLEYVILHELAHLVVPNHSKDFKKITAKYPLEERAKGFLIAIGLYEN